MTPTSVTLLPVDEEHPLLAAILAVRRSNAGSFNLTGNEFSAYDTAVLDCYRAVEAALQPASPTNEEAVDARLR